MISFALEEDQRILTETAHKFAAEVLRPAERAFERAGSVSAGAEQAFLELGLHLFDLPEAISGQGIGQPMTTAVLLHEELAWGDPAAAVALWAPHGVGPALAELGTAAQAERLLRPFADSPTLRRGAIAYAEPGPAQAPGFSTSAAPDRDRDGYLLSGQKCFVINAASAELTLVFAQLDGTAGWDGAGVFAIEGPLGSAPGARVGERHQLLGLGAVPAFAIELDQVFVPEDNRLRGDKDLCAAARRFFARMKLAAAARQVGLGRAAYEYALRYTQERRAFGKPVAHFQAIAFTLADTLMDVEAARWMVWHAAAAADQGSLDLGLCAQAAVHANEAAWRAADNCVQLLGGAGYMQDFPAEKWLRDTQALALLYGTAELHQELIADQELQATRMPGSPPGTPAPEGAWGLVSPALQPILT